MEGKGDAWHGTPMDGEDDDGGDGNSNAWWSNLEPYHETGKDLFSHSVRQVLVCQAYAFSLRKRPFDSEQFMAFPFLVTQSINNVSMIHSMYQGPYRPPSFHESS